MSTESLWKNEESRIMRKSIRGLLFKGRSWKQNVALWTLVPYLVGIEILKDPIQGWIVAILGHQKKHQEIGRRSEMKDETIEKIRETLDPLGNEQGLAAAAAAEVCQGLKKECPEIESAIGSESGIVTVTEGEIEKTEREIDTAVKIKKIEIEGRTETVTEVVGKEIEWTEREISEDVTLRF